jgi:oligoendopeptidase F
MKLTNTWNLKRDLLPSDTAWEKLYNRLDNKLKKVNHWKSRAKNSKNVLSLFIAEEKLDRDLTRLYSYASLNADLKNTNTKYKYFVSKINKRHYEIYTDLIWIDQEISKEVSLSTLKKWAQSKTFIGYHQRINQIIQYKKNPLNLKEERVLSSFQNILASFYNIYSEFEIHSITFPKIKINGKLVQLTRGKIDKIQERCSNRTTRKKVRQVLLDTYKKHSLALVPLVISHISSVIKESKLMKTDTPEDFILQEESLQRSDILNTMSTINKNKKTRNNLFKKLSKNLKIKDLCFSDLNYSKFNPVVSYEDSFNIITKTVSNLGMSYLEVIHTAYTENWIDAKYSDHKYNPRLDGYNYNPLITHPYVFINYENTFDNLLSLTHELGHAVHQHVNTESNYYYNTNDSLVMTESFAFTNELLILLYYIKNAKTKKVDYLNFFIRYVIQNIYKKGASTTLELELYKMIDEDSQISGDIISKKFKKILSKFFGNNINVNSGDSWSIGGTILDNYYSYKYIVAFLNSLIFSYKIFNNDIEFISKYKHALTVGDSESTPNVLLQLGIDLKDPDCHQEAFDIINTIITDF